MQGRFWRGLSKTLHWKPAAPGFIHSVKLLFTFHEEMPNYAKEEEKTK
jgi:hypothetical protein